MPIRMPSIRQTSAALLFVGLLALLFLASPKAQAGDDDHLVRVTYQVADLVIPRPGVIHVPDARTPGASATVTTEGDLIKLITSTVEPESWTGKGGPGTIDYHPLTMGLIICQTPDIQEQITDLLNSLRRLQDTQVALEVRIITVDEAFMDRLLHPKATEGMKQITGMTAPVDTPIDENLRVVFLTEVQVALLMQVVQDDPHVNVMQTPKMSLFNGQAGLLDLTEAQDASPPHSFINDFTVNHEASPEVLKTPIGLRLTAKPVVSADRRFVRLNLNASLTSLDSPELERIGIDQECDQGPSLRLSTATAIQPPHLSQLALDCVLKIPDGGTALISGWKRDREVRTESATPILSEIPYLNRLFTNVAYAREKECVLLLVTPRITEPTEQKECKFTGGKEEVLCPCACTPAQYVAPPACKSAEAAALVVKYHQACADGHDAEATQLAVQALAIDPACFHADGMQVRPCQSSGCNTPTPDGLSAGAPDQIYAIWDTKMHDAADPSPTGSSTAMLAGRVYLFGHKTTCPISAEGSLVVTAYNGETPPSNEAVPLHTWTFDAETLRRILKVDVIGWGYTVPLLWSEMPPGLTRVQLKVGFHPAMGNPLRCECAPFFLECGALTPQTPAPEEPVAPRDAWLPKKW